MARSHAWSFILLAAAWALSAPMPAHATDATDNCTGTISSLPAVIDAPGTWCMATDLATSITSGQAIQVATDNVVIDCREHLLDGSGGGSDSTARGINAQVNYTVVRNCRVRGFWIGIALNGAGNLVEDNLLEHELYTGIDSLGDGAVIRGNRVFDVGGSLQFTSAFGIGSGGSALVADNEVAGVSQGSGVNGYNVGIEISNSVGATVVGNRIRGIADPGNLGAYGIQSAGIGGPQRASIRGNDIVGEAGGTSVGIQCQFANSRAKNNTISGFDTGIVTCTNATGNVVRP